MPSHSILSLAAPNISLQHQLAKELGISRILAQVLINRKILTAQAGEKFFQSSIHDFNSPQAFLEMPRAVSLVGKARCHQEKVLVVGDYDVDGITSTVLLKNALAGLGLEVLHHIPHRVNEGYGLNRRIVEFARQQQVRLVVTADCGISNHEEIEALRQADIDVIVTDHHEPQSQRLPAASATINPKVKHSGYPFRELAGVGVAYKFAQAVTGSLLADDLDIVALGTIADSVPLTQENRIIAKEGLKRLAQTRRPGLRAIMENAGIENKKLNSTYVSFIIAPRLNAPGRLDHAEVSLRLLLAQDVEQARDLSAQLERFNRQRQKIESQILDEAESLINQQFNFKEDRVIVIAKEDWHQGVLGVVAARLADRFYRPAIVISIKEDLGKGSARSIKNFHLFEALLDSRAHLSSFGGHAHAAGLLITRDNIDEFRKSINKLASDRLTLEDLLPSRDVDAELFLGDLNAPLVKELERLEPFGMANPEPLFFTRALKLKSQVQLLARGTLKFWVTDGVTTIEAIAFGMSGQKESLLQADAFDLVYTPKLDDWHQEESLILEVKDIFFK